MTINAKPTLRFHTYISPIQNKGLLPLAIKKSNYFPSFGLCFPLDLKQAKILLVGDISKEKTVSILLSSWNAQVDTVPDAMEMIEKIFYTQYHLILIDLQMPNMNGWEAAKFIRTRMGKQIPLIALSSTILDFDQKMLKIVGFNGYLYKPIYPQTLRNVINMLNINDSTANDEEANEKQFSIDIEFIKNLAGGDLSFVQEIVHLFEQQTLEVINKIPLAQKNQDTKGIMDLVHKFKSSCNSVGNKDLHQLCGQIERETRKSELNWVIINKGCDSLIPQCHKIIEEIPVIQASLS